MNDKIASMIFAVTVAETITIPICTVKTVYQVDRSKNIRETIKYIHNRRGWIGFYNGVPPAIMSQTISTTSKYLMYELIKDYRGTCENDILNNCLNGVMGGLVGSVIAHPFDVLKNYRQMGKMFNKDLKIVGPKLFYRGYSQTINKNVMLYSMLYPTYDFHRSRGCGSMESSIYTSLMTTCILHPIDFFKTRRMAGENIFINWNPRTYYRGFTLNLSRVMPHFLITMSIVDYLCGKKE